MAHSDLMKPDQTRHAQGEDVIDAKAWQHTLPASSPVEGSLPEPHDLKAGSPCTSSAPEWSPLTGGVTSQLGPHALVFHADCYDMAGPHRGLAVIVNNEEFTRPHLSRRHGTEADCTSLEKLFRKMGFPEVRIKQNLTGYGMKRDLKEVAKDKMHTEASCFVLVILTHGEEGGVLYGTDGATVQIDDILALFKDLPSLRGKPKLFFVQACRGSKVDSGVDAVDAPNDDDDEKAEGDSIISPSEPDLLLAFSSVNGYYSWRHTVDGSWFVRSVVKVFENNWHRMDVGAMMTRVAQKMAHEFESNLPNKEKFHKKKQVPCVVSTLIKDLYFPPCPLPETVRPIQNPEPRPKPRHDRSPEPTPEPSLKQKPEQSPEKRLEQKPEARPAWDQELLGSISFANIGI